jgi:hypothetical protein
VRRINSATHNRKRLEFDLETVFYCLYLSPPNRFFKFVQKNSDLVSKSKAEF